MYSSKQTLSHALGGALLGNLNEGPTLAREARQPTRATARNQQETRQHTPLHARSTPTPTSNQQEASNTKQEHTRDNNNNKQDNNTSQNWNDTQTHLQTLSRKQSSKTYRKLDTVTEQSRFLSRRFVSPQTCQKKNPLPKITS